MIVVLRCQGVRYRIGRHEACQGRCIVLIQFFWIGGKVPHWTATHLHFEIPAVFVEPIDTFRALFPSNYMFDVQVFEIVSNITIPT